MTVSKHPAAKHRPAADKRRRGEHHGRKEHYLKIYWPYLPLLLIVLTGVFVNGLLNAYQRGVLGYATDVSINGLLNDTNSQRISNSLGSLALNGTLSKAAQAKANDMAARNYWSHDTPDGATPWTFITAAGYQYQTAGENLAYGFDTSTNTVIAWMNSAGHRENILNTTYTEVGFGMANSENYQDTGPETIVVAMYASPYAVASAPASQSSPSAPAQEPEPAQQTPAAQAAPAAQEAAPESNATDKQTTSNTDKPKTPDSAKAQVASDKPVTRVQLIANDKVAPWSVFAVSVIATVSVAVFLLRHGLAWHRVVVKGQKFIMTHKMLDIVLVSLAVVGVLLTRTVGFIR